LAYGGSRPAYYFIPLWFDIEELFHPPFAFTLATVLGTNFFISTILEAILTGIYWNLAMVSVLFVLRILLRNQKAAIVVSIIIMHSAPR
jgi:hypothetical protein